MRLRSVGLALALGLQARAAAEPASPGPSSKRRWLRVAAPADDEIARCPDGRPLDHWISERDGRLRLGQERESGLGLDDLPFEVHADELVGSQDDYHGVRLLHLGRSQVIAVHDGWLVSFDVGEWGGALWWFSMHGARRREILASPLATA